MTTIAEQVNEVKAAAASRLPAEVVAVFASDQAALAAGGIPAGAVSVGDTLAPFALPDATGQTRTLAELTADGPAVIVFYRGGWCPYCNLTLRTYERDLLPQLGAYSARLVAISPETPDASLSTQEKAELTYAVLSDTGGAARRHARDHVRALRGGPRSTAHARRRHPHNPRGQRHRAADADRPDRRPRPHRAIRRHPPRLHRPHRGQRHPRRARNTPHLEHAPHHGTRFRPVPKAAANRSVSPTGRFANVPAAIRSALPAVRHARRRSEQRAVELDGARGDRRPAEVLERRARPAGPKAPRRVRGRRAAR